MPETITISYKNLFITQVQVHIYILYRYTYYIYIYIAICIIVYITTYQSSFKSIKIQAHQTQKERKDMEKTSPTVLQHTHKYIKMKGTEDGKKCL